MAMLESLPGRIEFEGVCRRNGVRQALGHLLKAFDYAAGSGGEVWNFAVERATLEAAGAAITDLRWLTRCGYVVHAEETTSCKESTRTFRPEGEFSFSRRSCLILSPEGATAARAILTRRRARPATGNSRRGASSPVEPDLAVVSEGCVPRWDSQLRELRWRGLLVKRFRVPSPNQELVLAAFEEEGWPRHVDDPLPPSEGNVAYRRLHDAIRNLNQRQVNPVLRFKGDGRARGVCWEALPAGRLREKEKE